MTEKKVCFVIAPIGEENTEIRRRSDRVFKHIIEPAAEQCGYSALPAKDIPGSGPIMSEVIKHVVSAPLVIADLTGGNANVFYELALRHAVRKPVVQIIAKKEKIKFDVSQIRTLRFDLDEVIDDENRKSETIGHLVDYIRKEVLGNPTSTETPISITRASLWTPFPESPQPQLTLEDAPTTMKHPEDVLKELEGLPPAEAIPLLWKYIEDLLKNPRVRLLDKPIDDLDAACTLVGNVPEGGHISATSSLQNEDADERPSYRTIVNLALENNVTYRKVICFSAEQWAERHQKWLKEFTNKASLIRERKIKQNAFQLLHYPLPMSVDVLISQDADGHCKEMVAGFAGGGGQHGGFRADDEKMVDEWLNIYLEAKIIPVAAQHTKAVIEGVEECPCAEFLNLLDEARHAAASQPESPLRKPRRKKKPPKED